MQQEKIHHPSELCHLNEGIWMVKKIMNGDSASYITDRIDDIPKAMEKASFALHKNKVALNLETAMKNKLEDGGVLTLKEIVKVVFNSI